MHLFRRSDVYTAVRALDDETWRGLIADGASSYGGARLPAVPSVPVQRRFNTLDSRANLLLGFEYYQAIRAAAVRHGQPLTEGSRVLEFGCGWGRVLRCFLRDVPTGNLTGIDADKVGIEACRRAFSGVRFLRNDRWPPAALDAGSFDLVYAVSVFSHLPERMHLAWLAEMRRLLSPSGIFVASTLSRPYVEASTEFLAGALAAYDAGQFVFGDKSDPSYGQAAIPPAYIERVWSDQLDVLEVIPDGTLPQVLVVAKRPA